MEIILITMENLLPSQSQIWQFHAESGAMTSVLTLSQGSVFSPDKSVKLLHDKSISCN